MTFYYNFSSQNIMLYFIDVHVYPKVSFIYGLVVIFIE